MDPITPWLGHKEFKSILHSNCPDNRDLNSLLLALSPQLWKLNKQVFENVAQWKERVPRQLVEVEAATEFEDDDNSNMHIELKLHMDLEEIVWQEELL